MEAVLDDDEEGDDSNNKSCYLFNEDDWVRRKCVLLEKAWQFDFLIYSCIIISVFILAYQSPKTVPQDGGVYIFLWWIDVGTNCVFTVEAAVRIIANTFWTAENSYMSVPSQRLDFFIVLCPMFEYVSLLVGLGAFPNLKPLRAFRTLRVLRAVRFLTYFSHILEALGNALPRYIDVVTVLR